MAGPFNDFIPEGKDTGPAGKGFTDFVKPVVPVIEVPVEEVAEPGNLVVPVNADSPVEPLPAVEGEVK